MRRAAIALSVALAVPLAASALPLGVPIVVTSFATLPAVHVTGRPYFVTDCLTAACSAGGGSVQKWVAWSGSAYEVIGGSGMSQAEADARYALLAHTQAASTISDSTSAGRAVLTAADAAAQRTALGLGTAAVVNVPASGNAASGEAVKGSDTRLSDARTPSSTLAHGSTHASGGTDPITVTGYESALEGVLDLQDMQGAVTDAQVPNSITVDLAASATSAAGVACTDCVALGTETTGGYAASASEGGAATSVLASGLPSPSASTFGGVQSLAAVASNWLRSLGTDGIFTASQPAFTDLTGSATDAQVPNTITVDLATLATTATTANTGDSATAFFSSGAIEVARGGTGAAPGADDQVIVSDSTSSATWRALANCTDTGGNHLNYTAATNLFSCGTSGDGAGLSGLGSTDNAALRADGTGGATAQGSPVTISDNGASLTNGGTGVAICGPTISGGSADKPCLDMVTSSDSNRFFLFGFYPNAYGRAAAAIFRVGTSFEYASSGNPTTTADTSTSRAFAAVAKFTDAMQLTPRSSPPVTCGSANTDGVVYQDSDSHEMCVCNGTVWTGLIAGGACA